jgi:hypothetical protein
MMWRKDIGYDELSDNWFGVYIVDETGNMVCQAYGRTIEECDKNADRILETNYII